MADESVSSQEIVEGKIFALLSYLTILCIIPLVIKRNNRFVLHHGRQGLVLFVGEVALFVASIFLPTLLVKIGCFAFGMVSLWGIVECLRGRSIKIPVVVDIADNIIL